MVYASEGEKPWIEDTGLQFRNRPIPNFHQLTGGPVQVNRTLADGEVLVDGRLIYTASDLKVGLFQDTSAF